jgi:hypothetical protein
MKKRIKNDAFFHLLEIAAVAIERQNVVTKSDDKNHQKQPACSITCRHARQDHYKKWE